MLTSILRMFAIGAAGVWLGGMILIAIVAQTTFQTMRSTGVEHPNAVAGQIMAKNFSRFDKVQLICAAVLVICQIGQLAAVHRSTMEWIRLGLILAAAGILAYSVAVLTPKITNLQSAVAGADPDAAVRAIFDEFHDSAVRMSKINLCLVAILLGTLAFVPSTKNPIEGGAGGDAPTGDNIAGD